jgi:transglutaminase-like putative cysteine protease
MYATDPRGFVAPAGGGATPVLLPGVAAPRPVQLDAPRTYHLAAWGRMSDAQRVAWLRSVAVQRGRDPRIRELVFNLLRGVRERDYRAQAATLLRAVQPGGALGIEYRNEPGETLQDPLYTLRVRGGDCDDSALLLATLYEAIRLPWRFVLSGTAHGRRVRWVEGTPLPLGFRAAHIYVCVGWPPFRPAVWTWAEPTVRGKPLGWDATGEMRRRGTSSLPELAGPATSAGAAVAASTAEGGVSWRTIGAAVMVGVLTSVASQVLLDYLRWRRLVPPPASPR